MKEERILANMDPMTRVNILLRESSPENQHNLKLFRLFEAGVITEEELVQNLTSEKQRIGKA